jgi:D-glycero-alpha-D-manno-heptose-7-phosphate kinase
MIITQTPLRISFFGGGTDFPAYYQAEGGAVLSTTIDKYVYVAIKKRFDDRIRVGYTRTEIVDRVDHIEHALIREALRKTGVERGVEIVTMGDIPSEGSGLGSSSTVTVGALHAMYAYKGQIVSAEQLAREACEIEIDILGKPIGRQDQYIAALGGLRFIEFLQGGAIRSEVVRLSEKCWRKLTGSFMLFYTGISRKADDILEEQQSHITERLEVLRAIKKLAYTACQELKAGNVDCLGDLLYDSWLLKKQLADPISNGEIDRIYKAALEAGAIGGKLTGAGGGGFLLLYCPQHRQDTIRLALNGLRELPFQLEADGTKVIFNYRK